MNIAFYTDSRREKGSGSGIMRAIWPATWIQRYTEHHACYFSAQDLADPSHRYGMWKYDIVVFHKQHRIFVEIAAWLKKQFPHVVIVFDTDDYEAHIFERHYPLWFFNETETDPELTFPDADGYTLASYPIFNEYSSVVNKPCMMVENGFDLNLISNRPLRNQYFNGHLKIAYGGGTDHTRDLTPLLKLGALQELCDNHEVDFYVYGVMPELYSKDVKFKRGSICARPGKSINTYIEDLYGDAHALFAPLVQDSFNGYRSTLKLVEAGVSGKTIIASDVETYRHYLGRDSVTLVDNTPSAWYYALEKVITDHDFAISQGAANRRTVEAHYNAEYLTTQRINFYTSLIESK